MSRLPDLGGRGQGWVAGQFALLAAIGLGGVGLGGSWDGAARLVAVGLGAVGGAVGLLVAVRGLVDLGAALSPYPAPVRESVLVESGVYRRIRHPIYAGLVLGSVGWGLVWASPAALGLSVVLAVWLDLKARREEAWLAERHPGYAAYRARTRRFVPGLY